MRICFITPEFVTEEIGFDGGLANYLYRVSLALIQLGHRPLVTVCSDKNDVFDHNGIEVHRVNTRHQMVSDLSSPLQWLYESYSLNQHVKEIVAITHIDIIQYASYRATALYRIPTIPSVGRLSSYHHLLNVYYEHFVTKETDICERLDILALKNTDRIFGPSKFIADIIAQREQLEVEIIESPFVYDVPKLDFRPYEQYFQGKTYLLFFGTFGILKGVLSIADMLKKLFDKHPNLYFAFIGKDHGYRDHKMIDYVYQKVDKYKDRIIYLDKMPHAELYPIIMNSYAVILPSRIDNLPNACIEAMAHRKIVVGTRNTGFEQLIIDGENGFLCLKDHSEDLLDTVEKILLLDTQRKQIIENKAYKRILKLTPKKVVTKLIDYYSSVIHEFDQKNTHEKMAMSNEYIHQLLYDEMRKKERQIQCIYNSKSYKISQLIIDPSSIFQKLIKYVNRQIKRWIKFDLNYWSGRHRRN